jgi:RimJ/RimL family protein N-acetyltransferase
MKWTSTGKADVDQQVTQVWMNGFLPPNDAITFNFAVEELSAPGIVIGVLGCKTLEPPEVGYMFSPQAWGKGYATEALQKWLEVWWALPRKAVVLEAKDVDEDEDSREMLIPEVLMADMDSSNKASARIVTKCGFRQVSEGVVQQNGAAVRITVFELNRPQHN